MSEIGMTRVLVVGGTRGAGLLIARLLHQRAELERRRAAAEIGGEADLEISCVVDAGALARLTVVVEALYTPQPYVTFRVREST